MANVNLITGNDGANALTGGAGDDLIYGFGRQIVNDGVWH